MYISVKILKNYAVIHNFSPPFVPIVNIYSNWLQEHFCNVTLYTLYILSVQ